MSDPLVAKLTTIDNQKSAYIVPENIKTGVTVLGVVGTFTNDGTAIAEDIASGKTAYVNGNKITGTNSRSCTNGNYKYNSKWNNRCNELC